MAGERYNDEFKIAAVRQITQDRHSASSVADRLGVTTKSLYNWKARFGDDGCSNRSISSSRQDTAMYRR